MEWNKYDQDFILDRVAMHPETGCWLWADWRDGKDYGRVAPGSGENLAHRLSWRIFIGPIKPFENILHKCDNPPCCNPYHLFSGTQQDNVKDAMAKGRMRLSGGGLNKHSPEIVEKIHAMFAEGAMTHEVMKEIGISRTSVKLYRTNWNAKEPK